MHLVGFGHRARVGKDTAAQVLTDLGWQRLAFADPLRDVVYDLDPRIASLVNVVGWDAAKTVPYVRHALHRAGRSLRYRIGPYVLIDAVLANVTDSTVIADVRYLAEAEAILALGGQVVRIDRPGAPVLDLSSEHELDDWDGWSAVIENTGGIDDLADKVLAL